MPLDVASALDASSDVADGEGEDAPDTAATPDGDLHDTGPTDASVADATISDALAGQDADTMDTGTADAWDAAVVRDGDAGDAGDVVPPRCPPGAICTGEYNYAFVTSSEHILGMLGGVEAADRICNAAAAAAGLPGTYVAWLSATTMDARTRLGTASGWIRTDRRPFAASASDLYAGRLLYPLEIDERGNRVPDTSGIPTGTNVDGTLATPNCRDWSNTVERGIGGWPFMGSARWTTRALGQCNIPQRIYCLGSSHNRAIPMAPVAGRMAFVSSATFQADGGVAAADGLCNSEGRTRDPSRQFRAFLATSSASVASRFPAVGPTWVRADGIPIWEAPGDLAANRRPLAPVLMEIDGDRVPAESVWVGAIQTNQAPAASNTCQDWTSASIDDRGRTGVVDTTGSSWIGAGPWPCGGAARRLLCLEY